MRPTISACLQNEQANFATRRYANSHQNMLKRILRREFDACSRRPKK